MNPLVPLVVGIVMLSECVLGKTAESRPTGSGDFAPQMCESVYAPQKQRDPFDRGDRPVAKTPPPAKPAAVAPPPLPPKPVIPASLFRLQAILREKNASLAVVNGEVLELDKYVTMRVGTSTYRLKAVAIEREQVVLEVEGQKIVVRLEEPAPAQKTK